MNRKQMRAESEAFAVANLGACAAELVEWNSTGILRDGKMRELAGIVASWAGTHNSLSVAERIVNLAALRAVMTPK